jgi:hypothetical protein
MAVSNNNPRRKTLTTEDPCAIRAIWSLDHDDDSPRSLAVAASGQMITRIQFVIITAFDAGSIVIGKTGSTSAYMSTLNLVGLPVGTVVFVDLMTEFTEEEEIILTLTGNPTVGQIDGFCDFTEQMNFAK